MWAEWLQREVLATVPHRHVVLTMPRLLRGIFRKRRDLLGDLAQCSAEALSEYLRRQLGANTRPGIVVSLATSGDLVQWHPHGHLLVSDGAFSDDGTFHPLATWDGETVMKLFRERLLARLIERHAISQELARKLLAWRHPGFSAHIGKAIPFEDKKAIEDVACYVVRSPLSLKKLVYLDGQKGVLYRCGGPLEVVAYITDIVAIRRILDHLDLSPLEKPPPDLREVVRVPVDDEGREIVANPA